MAAATLQIGPVQAPARPERKSASDQAAWSRP
jgi:hypothetical protein